MTYTISNERVMESSIVLAKISIIAYKKGVQVKPEPQLVYGST